MKPDPTGYGLVQLQMKEPWSCMHRGWALSAQPEKPGASGEDESARCAVAGRQLRAGDLDLRSVGWNPNDQAVRDLTRARGAAVRYERAKRRTGRRCCRGSACTIRQDDVAKAQMGVAGWVEAGASRTGESLEEDAACVVRQAGD